MYQALSSVLEITVVNTDRVSAFLEFMFSWGRKQEKSKQSYKQNKVVISVT